MSRAAVHSQSYPSYPPAMKQGSGRRDGVEEERPSRLLQMRDDYHRRLLKEKEEKMINMYEDHQKRNQERAERVTRGGGNSTTPTNNNNNYPKSKLRQPGSFMQDRSNAHPRPAQMSSSPSLRQFFRERRELEAKGGYVPPIDQHYKQSKSRTSSSNSFHKTSAGVDRGQPLAPIHSNRPSPVSNASSSSTSSPFSNKPRLVKHNGSGNSSKNGSSPETDENDNNYKVNNNHHHDNNSNRASQQVRNSPRKAGPQGRAGKPGTQRPAEEAPSQTMSDFQKWQRDQSKAREDRLKKANNTRGPRDSENWEGGDENVNGGRGGGGGADGRKPSKDQEKMLMEQINQQQAELDRLKRQREEEAEMERREAEKAAKQEAAEKERRRRQQQQEEARRRREEEAQAKREKEEQRKAAARARDEDRHAQRNNNNTRNVQPTPRQPPHPKNSSSTPPSPQRQQPPSQRRPRSPEEEDEDVVPVPGAGSEIYCQAMEGERGGKVKLVPCKLCGRKFADDRVQKHQAACKKLQKKRKVMDSTQMRTEGTEMAKYVSKNAHKQEPQKKKKADWRRQHEEFIANIRYAKQMQQMEQQGVSPRHLPPPPPSHNPDLVPCPHCGRTFNEQSAERHIPRCQQLKTRPAANTKRR